MLAFFCKTQLPAGPRHWGLVGRQLLQTLGSRMDSSRWSVHRPQSDINSLENTELLLASPAPVQQTNL